MRGRQGATSLQLTPRSVRCQEILNDRSESASRGILLGDFMGRETARLGLLIFASSVEPPEAPGLSSKCASAPGFATVTVGRNESAW